ADREEGGEEGLQALLRLPGRPARGAFRRGDGEASRGRRPPGGAAHAAARNARPPADRQAQGVQGHRASPPGAAAQAAGDQVMAEMKEYIWGTGRRKSAVARVRLSRGSGSITVNHRP